jgi:serine/threonine protein kinase
MVVDVGEEELASGTTKRIKDALRLTDRGDVEQIVRHTMKGKEKESVKKGDLSFELTELAQDERDELKVRDELGQASEPTPGIVPIFEYEFINKKGEYKKRFFSERCDGDVTSLIFTKKKGGGLEPLPPEQRDTKRALHLLRDSVDIFERLHEAGLALLDLRLANILRKKDRPLLSDMASCTPMGCQFNRLLPGDDQIRPPEVLYAEKGKEPVLDEKSDLYAFGLALWEAYDPDGVAAFRDERFDGRQLLSLNAALAEGRSKGETPEILKKAKELDAERAQKRLGKLTASGDPVQGLIAELLDPDSTKRPQSFAEVKDKFSPALADYDAKERPSQPLGPEAIRRSVSPSSGV